MLQDMRTISKSDIPEDVEYLNAEITKLMCLSYKNTTTLKIHFSLHLLSAPLLFVKPLDTCVITV